MISSTYVIFLKLSQDFQFLNAHLIVMAAVYKFRKFYAILYTWRRYSSIFLVYWFVMGAKESRRLRRDLESLKRNDPTLKFLDCENIDIGSDGISALARALRNNTNLRKLKLGHCNIRQDGLNYLVKSLCEDRLVTSRLRKLELVSIKELESNLTS